MSRIQKGVYHLGSGPRRTKSERWRFPEINFSGREQCDNSGHLLCLPNARIGAGVGRTKKVGGDDCYYSDNWPFIRVPSALTAG